jgi:hypothetical protein
MLTRACARFLRAISRAATNISARPSTGSSSPSCESGGSGESRCAGAAADCELIARGSCRAAAARCGYITSRDGDSDAKPGTG